MQRIPKLKGFTNPFRVEYTAVNLAVLDALEGDEVTVQTLVEAGLVRPKALVKILGQGSLHRSVRVSAHAFSQAAEAAITAAGVASSGCRCPSPTGAHPPRATP